MDYEKTSRPPLQDSPGVNSTSSSSTFDGNLGTTYGGYQEILRGSHGVGKSGTKNAADEAATDKPRTTAPLMLRHRQQPLPFILPQPLGDLPPQVPHAGLRYPPVRQDFHPLSSPFPAPDYQRYAPAMPRAAHTGPMNIDTRHLIPRFLPPPDLGRRQSLGSLSSHNPYVPPPLPVPPRRSTSPLYYPGQPQPPVPDVLRASTANLASHGPTTFWPSPPSTSEGSISGMSFPGGGPPYPIQAAEHVRFQCDQCPESFPTNGVLKRHKKTHSARKYRCGCGAAYTDKSVLRVSPRSAGIRDLPESRSLNKALTDVNFRNTRPIKAASGTMCPWVHCPCLGG